MIYIGGNRNLPITSENVSLIERVIRAAVNQNETIHTGCQFGADQIVAFTCPYSSLSVFAVASQANAPAFVLHAQSNGARVIYEAGGKSASIRARYIRRSLAALHGARLAVFFQPGPGSLAVAREAVKKNIPVYSFSANPPAPIPGNSGAWVESSLFGLGCFEWSGMQVSEQPDLFKAIENEITAAVLGMPAPAVQLPTTKTASIDELPTTTKRQTPKEVKHANKICDMQVQMQRLADEINKTYKTEAVIVNSPLDASRAVAPYLSGQEQEEFLIISLNRRNHIIEVTRLYKGSASSAQVRIGEVFRRAIMLNASAIICAHNHPSGDPTPSPDDIAVTKAIHQAGKLLDIELLDSMVIGHNGKFVSLKERGLGFC